MENALCCPVIGDGRVTKLRRQGAVVAPTRPDLRPGLSELGHSSAGYLRSLIGGFPGEATPSSLARMSAGGPHFEPSSLSRATSVNTGCQDVQLT